MEAIFNKICVLVTVALALTLVPSSMRSKGSLMLVRGRGTSLLVFLLLGLVEDAVVRQTGWFNHRIVVVCAANLLAGRSEERSQSKRRVLNCVRDPLPKRSTNLVLLDAREIIRGGWPPPVGHVES
jgi:hypothetical protein